MRDEERRGNAEHAELAETFFGVTLIHGTAAAAAGTAAAIAYPPMGSEDYARRNGFVCTPGTWFRGEDGRRHICQ